MQAEANKTRRSYGTGSLYTRKDSAGRETWYGRWWAVGSPTRRALGLKRTPGSRDGLTELQAERELSRLMHETPRRAPVSESLNAQELGARYVRDAERRGLRLSSVTAVRSVLDTRIVPFFEDKAVAKYTPRDVQAFVTKLEDDELSNKTIRNYVGILSAMFKYAVRKKLAPTNPCVDVELPAKDTYTSDDIHFLRPEEVHTLARSAQSGAYEAIDRALYITAAMTGLRQGELLALRWRDVDWPASSIRVRQNFVLGEYGKPKSKRSTRSVPMADDVGGELDRLFKAASYTTEDDLVFADPYTGEPLRRGALMRRYRRALKAAKLNVEHRFHDLRHTFGTAMAAAGVPLRTLQEWMGHRDIATTQIYADYAPKPNEAAQVTAAFKTEPLEPAAEPVHAI